MQLSPIYRREFGDEPVVYEVALERRQYLDPMLFEPFKPCTDENDPEACTTVRCPQRGTVLFYLPGPRSKAEMEAALEFFMSGLVDDGTRH